MARYAAPFSIILDEDNRFVYFIKGSYQEERLKEFNIKNKKKYRLYNPFEEK